MPTETSTLDGGKLVLDAATLDALQARLRGPVLAPGIEGFDDACRIWNGMIRSRPALVVRATGTADVVECVRFAAHHRLLVSAKCGGHNIAGTSLAEGGLTIDMSRMKGVLVDPARRWRACRPAASSATSTGKPSSTGSRPCSASSPRRAWPA